MNWDLMEKVLGITKKQNWRGGTCRFVNDV